MSLNPQQRLAIEHVEGPLLVIAGAGSGKTRVLTERIAQLIKTGRARPEEILALTFTNKAAEEMRERANNLTNGAAAETMLSTFHSACARWLRFYGEHVGLNNAFSILDEQGQRALMKTVLERMQLETDMGHRKYYLKQINRLKQKAWRPKDAFERTRGQNAEIICSVYEQYQAELERNNVADFGDLIAKMVHLLEKNKTIKQRFREFYPFIMVDEYQDTNGAQFRLLNLLARKNGNIMAVGDDDQSIYRWRGATVKNVFRFQKYHDQCRIITLEENYRSTSLILDAAHSIIEKVSQRMPKKLRSTKEKGEKIRLFSARNERNEAEHVANTIIALKTKHNIPYSDCAIFYRTNAQTRNLEEQLRLAGINYQIVKGQSFFERKEVKDLIAYLRLIHNPADDIAFRRVINIPKRGIGDKTRRRIENWRQQNKDPHLLAAIQTIEQMPGRRLPNKAFQGLLEFHYLFKALRSVKEKSAAELLHIIIDKINYLEYLTKEDEESCLERKQNVQELVNAAKTFALGSFTSPNWFGQEENSITSFLEYVSLRESSDNLNNDQEEKSDKVQLMTVHTSKGLEFPVVFVVGLEEGLFPLKRRKVTTKKDTHEIFSDFEDLTIFEKDDERRLCYVAFTRAEKLLYLSHASERFYFGSSQQNMRSTFISNLNPDFIEQINPKSSSRVHYSNRFMDRHRQRDQLDQRVQFRHRKTEKEIEKVKKESPEQERIRKQAEEFIQKAINKKRTTTGYIGRKIRHKAFGIGTIVSIMGTGERAKANILFPSIGERKIVMKYVELLP